MEKISETTNSGIQSTAIAGDRSTEQGVKHTPGPWEAGSRVVTAAGRVVLDINQQLSMSVADARLIAAAPEMLEALLLARMIIGHPDDAGSKFIDDTIAKATGAA